MHDGTDPVCSDDCPDEEGEASGWDKECLHREKMSDFVDRKPDGRE